MTTVKDHLKFALEAHDTEILNYQRELAQLKITAGKKCERCKEYKLIEAQYKGQLEEQENRIQLLEQELKTLKELNEERVKCAQTKTATSSSTIQRNTSILFSQRSPSIFDKQSISRSLSEPDAPRSNNLSGVSKLSDLVIDNSLTDDSDGSEGILCPETYFDVQFATQVWEKVAVVIPETFEFGPDDEVFSKDDATLTFDDLKENMDTPKTPISPHAERALKQQNVDASKDQPIGPRSIPTPLETSALLIIPETQLPYTAKITTSSSNPEKSTWMKVTKGSSQTTSSRTPVPSSKRLRQSTLTKESLCKPKLIPLSSLATSTPAEKAPMVDLVSGDESIFDESFSLITGRRASEKSELRTARRGKTASEVENDIIADSSSDELIFGENAFDDGRSDLKRDRVSLIDQQQRCSDGMQAFKQHVNSVFNGKGTVPYKYANDPVRKKDERKRLNGYCCKSCEDYFENACVSEEDREARLKNCSRHRSLFAVPPTPEHYWKTGFPSSGECKYKGYVDDSQRPPLRSRRKRKRATKSTED